MKKIARFFIGVKKELGKVRLPNKKEMITYSVATISFILIFGLFFGLTDFIFASIRTFFN